MPADQPDWCGGQATPRACSCPAPQLNSLLLGGRRNLLQLGRRLSDEPFFARLFNGTSHYLTSCVSDLGGFNAPRGVRETNRMKRSLPRRWISFGSGQRMGILRGCPPESKRPEALAEPKTLGLCVLSAVQAASCRLVFWMAVSDPTSSLRRHSDLPEGIETQPRTGREVSVIQPVVRSYGAWFCLGLSLLR